MNRFGHQPLVRGSLEIARARRLRFPAYSATVDGEPAAVFGRYSWFRIFFGGGQPILLADGTRWRLRGVNRGRLICPLIVDDQRRNVVMGAYGDASYGVNGRDYGFMLYGDDVRRQRARHWTLREHETDLALIERRPRRVTVSKPVPLSALLLSFVLLQFGVPGEDELRLSPMWG